MTVVREWGEDIPPIHGSRAQLERAFHNLLTNAGRAMSDGGTLTLRTRQEAPPLSQREAEGGWVAVDVEDTGIGIPPDEQRQRALVAFFFSGVREGRVEVLSVEGEPIEGPVTITSTIPLTDAEKAIIREEMRSRLGEDIDISFRVDPKVLGGLVVRAGDRVLDGSVVGQLERLQESLV